jgi:hypothetical protein
MIRKNSKAGNNLYKASMIKKGACEKTTRLNIRLELEEEEKLMAISQISQDDKYTSRKMIKKDITPLITTKLKENESSIPVKKSVPRKLHNPITIDMGRR